MGKRILAQRKGRGGFPFRVPTHRRVAPAAYPSASKLEGAADVRGWVKDIVHDPGRGTPLALIKLEGDEEYYTVASEGLAVGGEVQIGAKAPAVTGNVLPLRNIPEGTMVCNVELSPNDGGRFIRASGTYGVVLAHTEKGTSVKLPSGKVVTLSDDCRATIGVVSAGGRIDKPFLKAGNKLRIMRARGRKYPTVRGVAMISVYHPHGGGRHQHPGKPTTVGRTTPPGRKVGLIAAKQTGRGGKFRKRELAKV